MSTFFAWFDATRTAALATPAGRQLAAAGFQFVHTGGGCTAWELTIASGEALTITNELGTDADPLNGEWLVGGSPEDRGDWFELGICATVREAIRTARNYRTLTRLCHRRRKAMRKLRVADALAWGDAGESGCGFMRDAVVLELADAAHFRRTWPNAPTTLGRSEVIERTVARCMIHLNGARSNREAAPECFRLA